MSRRLRGTSGDTQGRLLPLAGLVVIVGGVLGILFVAGLIGKQGGGEGIRSVSVVEPPRVTGQEALAVGPRVGALAPDFEISDFDGLRHRLSDFRGKAVYVNFWATWCIPCTVELPDIQALQEAYAQDLAVITVNRRERVDNARSYFANLPREDGGRGVSFAVNGIDPDDTLYEEYRALGMPVSFFIDANGVVTRLYNGLIPLAAMEEAVMEALAAGQGSVALGSE